MIEDSYIKIAIVQQGDCEFDREPYGYMTMGSIESGALAFHIDLPSKNWEVSGLSSAKVHGKSYPSFFMYLLDEDTGEYNGGRHTEISFTEFEGNSLEGWSVHCVSGGDELSVCLTNDKKWFKDRSIK